MRELDSIAVVGAGRLGTALAAALRASGATVEGPLGRGAAPHLAVVLLCVPDGEIADRGRRRRARPARRPLLRRDRPGAAGRPRGVLPAPADDRPRGLAARACSRAPAPPSTARRRARWRWPPRWPSGSGCGPRRVAPEDRVAYHAAASIASNFLVTLEWAAERLAATAGVSREQLAPLVRAAVETWVRPGRRAGAHRPDRPRRRGDRRAPARGRAGAHARAGAAVRRARGRHPRAGRAGGARRDHDPHQGRDARATWPPPAPPGARVGLVPTMGAFHAGHHALMAAAREACDEVVVSLFVNPAQFNEASDLAAYPRDEARDAAEADGARRRRPVRAHAGRGLSRRVRDQRARRGPRRRARGRRARRRATSPASARSWRSCSTSSPPTSPTSARRTPSRSPCCGGWSPTSTSRSGSRSSPPCASPTGWRCPAATSASTPASARRAVALSQALRAAEAALARRRARRGPPARGRPGRHGAPRRRARVPRARRPRQPSSPSTRVDGRVLVAVAARVGDTRLIDNAVLSRSRDRWRPQSRASTTTKET